MSEFESTEEAVKELNKRVMELKINIIDSLHGDYMLLKTFLSNAKKLFIKLVRNIIEKIK